MDPSREAGTEELEGRVQPAPVRTVQMRRRDVEPDRDRRVEAATGDPSAGVATRDDGLDCSCRCAAAARCVGRSNDGDAINYYYRVGYRYSGTG